MDYRALNNFAWTMGEALKEKVNLAMLSDILRMRFAHYLGEFADDEGFLQMTYQARLQVEQMKDLEKITEGIRAPKPEDKKKTARTRRAPTTPEGARKLTKPLGWTRRNDWKKRKIRPRGEEKPIGAQKMKPW